MAQYLSSLEERHRVVLGELQDAVVELHPGDLAVDEEARIVEVDAGIGRVVDFSCFRDGFHLSSERL